MLDHVYIVASDMVVAERFYDAVMDALGVVKVGSRADWIGYGERADAGHPDRIYIAIRQGAVPQAPYPLHWCFKARSRPRSMPSGTQASRPEAATMARRDCATITRPITQRSCAIRTATGSRPSVITRSDWTGFRTQKERARQTFMKSDQYAGFIDAS
jgi:hypothetical protein